MNRFVFGSALLIGFPSILAAEETGSTELSVGSFSVRPDTVRNQPTIEVDVVLVIEPGNVRHHRLDRLMTERHGSATTASADSRTCPAVLEQMAKVEDLPMPTFVAPGSNKDRRVQMLMHPTTYTLALRGFESGSNSRARVEVSAPSGSPLAQWAEETLAALEPCWSLPAA